MWITLSDDFIYEKHPISINLDKIINFCCSQDTWIEKSGADLSPIYLIKMLNINSGIYRFVYKHSEERDYVYKRLISKLDL